MVSVNKAQTLNKQPKYILYEKAGNFFLTKLEWLGSVHDKEKKKKCLNHFEILLVSYGFEKLLYQFNDLKCNTVI